VAKGNSEQQVQIGPKDIAADQLDGVQQVMMVVPVDRDIDKTQQVTKEGRQHRLERAEFDALRRFQFQHHDSDDDGKHAIAECFQPIFFACFISAKHIGHL